MTTAWDDYEAARTETDAALARVQPRGYAMTTDAKKRLAETQAELLAAADPHAWPESAELVELRATVARVRELADEWDAIAGQCKRFYGSPCSMCVGRRSAADALRAAHDGPTSGGAA